MLDERVEMAKHEKSEVGYEDKSTHAPDRCAMCSMFVPANSCTDVKGHIYPSGWCRIFERSRMKNLQKRGLVG